MNNHTYNVGDRVIKSGYEGVVTSEYLPGMYEVRLASGGVVVPACDLKPAGKAAKD